MSLRLRSFMQAIPDTRKVDAGKANPANTDWQDIFDSVPMLRSEVVDGPTAVAAYIDTTTAWANAAARLYSFRTNTVEKAYVLASGRIVAASFGGIQAADVPDLSATYSTVSTFNALVASLGSAAFQPSSAFATAGHNHDLTYAPLSHTHAASAITSGTIATARLGTGVADATTFLRGDQTWAAPGGGGAFLPLAGGTMTGTVTWDTPGTKARFDVDGSGAKFTEFSSLGFTIMETSYNSKFICDSRWMLGASNVGFAWTSGLDANATAVPETMLSRYGDGKVVLTGANPAFAFGGTTSSYPMLKRSTTAIHVWLADNSDWADFAVKNLDVVYGTIFSNGVQMIRMAFGTDIWLGANESGYTTAFGQKGFFLPTTYALMWYTGGGGGNAAELFINRPSTGICRITKNNTDGVALEVVEITAPAAPATNGVRFYAEDNGAGKTRLMALFPTGAAQVLATEP